MTPYAVRYIPEQDIDLLRKLKKVLEDLPDLDLGLDQKENKYLLSCHMVARAVANVFGLRVVDGNYLNIYKHSWVLTESGNIMDVYPVATLGGPILIHYDFFGIDSLYRKCDISSFTDLNSEKFTSCVKKVEEELRSVVAKD